MVERCDLCDDPRSEPVLRGTDHREGLGGIWDIRACSSCGLARTDPRPRDLAAWYPPTYQQHSDVVGITERVVAFAIRRAASERPPRTARALLEWLIPDAALGGALPVGTRALDIGAGNGNAVSALRAAGLDAHGLEPSAAAVATAKARGIDGINQGTLEDTALQSNSWGLIRVCQVLEHVPSPRTALGLIRPALADGGRLVIGVPNFGGALSRLARSSWDGLELPRHVHHFTSTTLRRLLDATGFEVVALRTAPLFGVLPATLDALTSGGRRQRGWRRSLLLRIGLHPIEVALAAVGLGDGLVAVARRRDRPGG
jgi:SAM-dependent methyltransferase